MKTLNRILWILKKKKSKQSKIGIDLLWLFLLVTFSYFCFDI